MPWVSFGGNSWRPRSCCIAWVIDLKVQVRLVEMIPSGTVVKEFDQPVEQCAWVSFSASAGDFSLNGVRLSLFQDFFCLFSGWIFFVCVCEGGFSQKLLLTLH